MGDYYTAGAISADGNYMACGGWTINRTIYYFHKSSSIPLWSCTLTDEVQTLDISADGKYIAASAGSEYYLFNNTASPSKTYMWKYDTGAGIIYDVAISADGQYIAGGDSNNRGIVFSRDSTILHEYLSTASVLKVDIASDSNYVLMDDNKHARLYDPVSNSVIQTYDLSGVTIWSLCISSDGNTAVIGDTFDKIHLFQSSSATHIWEYDPGSGSIAGVDISKDSQYIIAGSTDDNVYMFSISSSTPLWEYNTGNNIRDVSISSHGYYGIAGCLGGDLFLFNRLSSTPLNIYAGGDNVQHCELSLDGTSFIVANEDNYFYYYKTEVAPGAVSIRTNNNAEMPITNGTFNLLIEPTEATTEYSIYTYPTEITTINNSLTQLATGYTEDIYTITSASVGIHYYIVTAENEYGQTNSNCLRVEVSFDLIAYLIEPTTLLLLGFAVGLLVLGLYIGSKRGRKKVIKELKDLPEKVPIKKYEQIQAKKKTDDKAIKAAKKAQKGKR